MRGKKTSVVNRNVDLNRSWYTSPAALDRNVASLGPPGTMQPSADHGTEHHSPAQYASKKHLARQQAI